MPRDKRSYQQSEMALADERPFPPGFHYLPHYLDGAAQRALLSDIRQVLGKAPLFQQTMPRTVG
jgi:alkylated DNA repair dioxygenase AlkB